MPSNTPFDSKDFANLTEDLLKSLRSGAGGRPALTDDTEGSVVRTLAEAFARELAVCYQQLNKVYQYGYLNTAEGVALDNVVALLGITRQKAGHIEGSVTFSRSQPAPEDILVPPGTRVAGRDVPVFETTQDAILPKGQKEITVKVRSLEPGDQSIKAGSISLMPRPIWGVENVANRADLLQRQREETDMELRERARHILQKANLGTVAAIQQAVYSLGIAQVTVREDAQNPGTVEVVLGDPDISADLLNQAKAAVQEVRPAGIQVHVLVSDRVLVQIEVTLVLREDFPEDRKNTIREQITQALQSYFDSLKTGELVRWAKITAILTGPGEVVELLPPVQGSVYLRPFAGLPGQMQDATASHSLRNGDIAIGTNERAALDLTVLPLLLSLEPPALDVWVDVALSLPQGQTPPDEKPIRDALQARLDTFKPGQTVGYENLAEVLDNSLKPVSFRLIHSMDNLSVTLGRMNDNDLLKDRERMSVGHIDFIKEGQNG